MSALRALPTIAEEERPSYDGEAVRKRRHLTVIDDDAVDEVIEACGFTAAGIYMLLERKCHRDGVCRGVSYGYLQERGGITRRHAIRLVQQLRSAGFVVIRERVVRGRHIENEFVLPRHLCDVTTPAINNRGGDMVVTLGSDTGGDMPPGGSDMSGDTGSDTLNKRSSPSSLSSPVDASPAGDAPPAEPPKRKEPEATRLPDDIELSDEWRQAAIDMGYPARDVEWQFEKFRDYWHAKAKDAKKTNWYLTWLNWLREEMSRKGMPISPLSKRSKPSTPQTVQNQQHDYYTRNLLQQRADILRNRANTREEMVIWSYDQKLAELDAELTALGVRLEVA